MHGIATGAPRYVHELINAEITLARGRRTNGIGFVGQADMQGLTIDVTEDCCGADAQFAASAQDTHGDLTAIGNQDFPEHGWFARLRNFNTRFDGSWLAVRLACPIICGIKTERRSRLEMEND